MGIILRYVCWGTHRPPPGGPAADRPTRRPPRFGSTKGGGRGPPPPPLQPPKLSNTPRGHTLAGASPRASREVASADTLPPPLRYSLRYSEGIGASVYEL